MHGAGDMTEERLAQIRVWAVDEPMIRRISLVHPAHAPTSSPPRLRLSLSVAPDRFGCTLSPFSERKSHWAAALTSRLKIDVDLQRDDARQSTDGATLHATTIWPRSSSEIVAL